VVLGPVPDRPIRVVLFGGGPTLERDVREFLCLLEGHPEIDLLGAFCQSPDPSIAGILGDLWKRRRWLAGPVLALHGLGLAGRWITAPRIEMRLRRKLRSLAERIHTASDIHAREVRERIQALEPDLGLVYGSPILRPSIFQIPRFGSLGIHHGTLPSYRGKKTTFWEMARGESEAGVTIQRIGKGLDSGAIVREGRVNIGRRSYSRVWREVLELGLDLYLQAVLDVREGTATCRKPAGRKGKLYRDPKLKDLLRYYWKRIGS
jgi:folate-dependent phosphoribosylglycinamide formyltransferase PurN